MRIFPFIKLFVISSLFIYSELVFSSEILSKIEKGFATITNIKGFFIQRKNISFLENEIISRGLFVLKKPDLLRWELKNPINSLIIVNKSKILQWDEATCKTRIFDLKRDRMTGLIFEQILNWFNGNFNEIKEKYTVELTGKRNMTLVPLSSSMRNYILKIIIGFNDDLSLIKKIKIVEPNGDFTCLEFIDIVVNKKIDAAEFLIK